MMHHRAISEAKLPKSRVRPLRGSAPQTTRASSSSPVAPAASEPHIAYQLKARDVMSTELITLEHDETLDLADEIMKLARVRHLPVVQGGTLVGLITHRDLLRAQVSVLAGLSNEETRELEAAIPVANIMITGVRTVAPDTPAIEAARLMRDHKIGCLPVVDAGQLVGILTEADFLELVIKALDAASHAP